MIAYAKKTGACSLLHFNTNCLALDDEKIRRILHAGADDITLSIDATDAESFARIKGADVFQTVLRNAHAFYRIRQEIPGCAAHIRVKMLGTSDNPEGCAAFREYWSGIADEVQIQIIHNFGGGIELAEQVPPVRYPCEFPFFSTAVNWDGGVCICHRDWKGEHLAGSVAEASLKSIYQSSRYQEYRRCHLAGATAELPLCRGCNNWKDGPELPRATLERFMNHRNDTR